MENITHINEFVDNFEKFIIYKTCTTIKNIYKSLDNYFAVLKLLTKPYHSLSESEIHAINRFNELFKLDKYTVEKIITKPRINGKQVCITKQVLNLIKERGIIKTFNHGTIRYKSGKNFSLSTKYTIDISVIQSYFNNEDVYNTNSNFYTKKQHKLIDKFIHNYKNENKPKQTKKVKTLISHPENDIQIKAIHEDQLIPRLQEFIDKKYISLKFAKTFLKRLGTTFNHLHEPNNGTCSEELLKQESYSARKNILGYIIQNYKERLDEDDYKKYIETYRQLAK